MLTLHCANINITREKFRFLNILSEIGDYKQWHSFFGKYYILIKTLLSCDFIVDMSVSSF